MEKYFKSDESAAILPFSRSDTYYVKPVASTAVVTLGYGFGVGQNDTWALAAHAVQMPQHGEVYDRVYWAYTKGIVSVISVPPGSVTVSIIGGGTEEYSTKLE